MLNAKDIGEILVFLIGGFVLSLIVRNINPFIAGVIVSVLMIIVKCFFRGTPNIKKTKSLGG